MKITEKLVKEYAKKIFGFAYSKTKNFHNAEDLAQDIILTLCSNEADLSKIENMDAYVWRVSNYTWSNYIRKNKPVWSTLENAEALDFARDDCDVEGTYIENETREKLRREVMYLSKMRRDITVMYYYENKSGNEISELLGIPAATVRWHMSETKKLLKERIDMTDSIYTPKKLEIYFSGNANDFSLRGLRDDLLVHNICIVCAKKALTIEEIASTMGMNAAFIESKLDDLLYMNYLEKVGANKYKTTFFIKDAEFIAAKERFEMANLPPIARAIYKSLKNHLDEIRGIGFMGAELPENFLMWTLCTRAAHDYLNSIAIRHGYRAPMRGDGSRHWIKARIICDEREVAGDDKELADYFKYSGGRAGAHTSTDALCAQQFDPPVVMCSRGFIGSQALGNFKRIYTIIKEVLEMNEHDKEIISLMASAGFVRVKDGRPEILVPYMTTSEYDEFCRIIAEVILPEVKTEAGDDICRRYAEYMEKIIPAHISEAERAFAVSDFYEPNAYAYLLYREGLLEKLSNDEKKRVCTMIWNLQ